MRDGSVVYPYHQVNGGGQHQQPLALGSSKQAYRSSLSLSPPASSPSSTHRTSPMTWSTSLVPQVATAVPSFEPHTPPPICAGATGVMDPYAATWVPSEYDTPYGGNDMPTEDLLLVKPAPNALARPLHSYMAPLSITSQPPTRPLSPPPSKRIDMRLAQPGSEESKPGYLTPLASYTGELWLLLWLQWRCSRADLVSAQTFWYFWYADMFGAPPHLDASARRLSEDLSSSTSRPFDSEGRPRHPIHPSNFQPNLAFNQFVYSVLHSTQVSFSVTILALMYTYKYKKIQALGIRKPYHAEVSEAQGFVTGLMLANKYLDDNTYTNTTWAQFLGMPVKDVNEYELEWLDALEFNLCIRTDEFETWRAMLDAHVRSRERGDASASFGAGFGSAGQGVRARSASPPLGYYSPSSGLAPAPEHALRKRSARDAFAADTVHNAGMYEAARLDPRKSSFVSLGQAPLFQQQPQQQAATAVSTPAPDYSPAATLARSSSLNRQIARLPANPRRDSSGQEQMVPAVLDLRHAAAANAAQNWQYPSAEAIQFNKEERWRIPHQPRLYFLQAAATPQFGPDGRYHKAIPHYFDPNYATYDVAAATYQGQQEIMDIDAAAAAQTQMDLASADPAAAMMMNGAMPMTQPQGYVMPMMPSQPVHHHPFLDSQPAPFANAGPPGYVYGAPGWAQAMPHHPQPPQPQVWSGAARWKAGHMSRWSTSSDDFMFNLPRVPVCAASNEYPTMANGF